MIQQVALLDQKVYEINYLVIKPQGNKALPAVDDFSGDFCSDSDKWK